MEQYKAITVAPEQIANGYIPVGNLIKVGTDEKTRNHNITSVFLPMTLASYRFFNNGPAAILETVAQACAKIANGHGTEKDYQTIIENLHFVHHHSTAKQNSKLDGINSLSTCCLDNPVCIDRMKCSESVCCHCYASTQQKSQNGLTERNIINGIILKNILLPVKYLKKYISSRDISDFTRFESFGDVANKNQAINYIRICKAFPRKHFTVWTKNPGIWKFAIEEEDKPKNLVIVYSSMKINIPSENMLKMYPFLDHLFTVYSKEFIQTNSVQINCGGRSCKDCIKKRKNCYFRNDNIYIREQLK